MNFWVLSLTGDPRQIRNYTLAPDGISLHARVEVRYLPATEGWVLSLWDESSGELLVNQIPLVCSYGPLLDLFTPFRHLRAGRGIGSCYVLPAVDAPDSPDPGEKNLKQFFVCIGDTL